PGPSRRHELGHRLQGQRLRPPRHLGPRGLAAPAEGDQRLADHARRPPQPLPGPAVRAPGTPGPRQHRVEVTQGAPIAPRASRPIDSMVLMGIRPLTVAVVPPRYEPHMARWALASMVPTCLPIMVAFMLSGEPLVPTAPVAASAKKGFSIAARSV